METTKIFAVAYERDINAYESHLPSNLVFVRAATPEEALEIAASMVPEIQECLNDVAGLEKENDEITAIAKPGSYYSDINVFLVETIN